jgi:DNA repair exonuclease SbcCD ATPase subunit
MPPEQPDSGAPLADQKLALEIQKLQGELDAQRQPPRRWSLTAIAGVLTVAATLAGAGFQYKLNQIKAEQTTLEIAKLEARHGEVQQLLQAAITNLESTTQAQNAAQAKLGQIMEQLTRAESQLASTAPGPQATAARAALGEARASLDAVSAAVQRSSNSVEADIGRLQTLRQQIRSSGPAVGLATTKVGIYFLRDNPAALRAAEQIRDALSAERSVGAIELYPRDRAFFETVNAPSGDEVRYEPGREERVARELANTLERLTARRFALRTVATPTPGFLSVMVAEGLR